MPLRRPRLLLGFSLLVVIALGLVGLHVENKLKPTSLDVSGTASSQAGGALHRYFGDSAPFAILLRGPSASLERQGPQLIRALRKDPGVTTISPWDNGSLGRLRPSPRRALVLVDFHVDIEEAVNRTVPQLNELLRTKIRAPIRGTQTGFASLSRAIQEESIHGMERGELIAMPVLLVVLLLVFRSPIAALIPLLFGAITVITSRGVLALATSWLPIDAFALTVSTMMGLALGVDYALLMVSRFREELADGADPTAAALATRRTAGRTILFAGSTLFLSMAVAVPILPGALLVSLAGTVVIVVVLSATVATVVAPALLAMVGSGIDRWRIGRASGDRSRLTSMVNACLRRPLAATLIIGGLVLALASPALALKTGPPSPEQLPTENQARRDAEEIDAAAGPGWEAPFIVVASTPRGTITEESRLTELSHWQRKIASDPAVQLVIGPAEIAHRVAPLQKAATHLFGNPAGDGQLNQLRRLGPKLSRAESGVAEIRSGLASAAAGADLLGTGSGHAEDGAATIASGLQRALRGGDRALRAVNRMVAGSGDLASGQGEAKAGALAIKLGLTHLLKDIRPNGLERARRLRDRLAVAAKEDPALEPAVQEANELVEHLAINRSELKLLRGESETLHAGESKLLAGNVALHQGAQRLAEGAVGLPAGLTKLENGAKRLMLGLAQLRGGAGVLKRKLGEGFHRSYPLQSGLHRASVRVIAQAGAIDRKVVALHRRSPALFNSGYFILSALDGAPTAERQNAAETVNLKRGGQAAAILVIPRYTFNTPGSTALYHRLEKDAETFSNATGIRVGVAGGAAQLTDYASVTRAAIPLVVIAITIATFFVMVIVLRALLLAAIAVALNLATVGVAFGVVTLLFNVPSGYFLGGHTYVDAVGATAIFGVVFGLSIDYAVFLLTRIRESYQAGGSNKEAVLFGLEKTARVITGAAAIMMAVFVAFAGAPIATISQLGVGLTVAVLLDATVVRIVLLPALMLLLGDRVWWLPRPLRNLLPAIDLHGEARVGQPG
ncbi:MAG: MMPL family transporter [Solirubrobacterales bacterium]